MIALVLGVALLAAGCATWSASGGAGTLYDDLGGRGGITAIVDAFLEELADDTRVAPFFADTDIERFRRLLIEQFCAISDGPCEYTGEDMETVHAGMGIDEAEFNAVVEDLIAAMEEVETPIGAQNRLLALLAPMRDEIIYR